MLSVSNRLAVCRTMLLRAEWFNAIKQVYPNANLIAIDFDASISKVNQINRIKLMISIAKNGMVQRNI